MADFVCPYEGARRIGTAGVPSTVYMDLSTKSVDSTNPFAAPSPGENATFATRGVITGTGYSRGTCTGWTSTGGTLATFKGTFATGAATNWPANVRSAVCTDGVRMLWAWNLVPGGSARDMSAANTTEIVRGTVVVD